ncbi:MAG: UDP-3-O-acyl-N-acetylglucosamine deacetylase [Planctomycetaceae bacterium]|jgi:UDP-3-O-acyl N-acetylglucosamine deacetylase|nr:UDP-3-O-acyl-N-acetylglucosamine deacetylase [Planctomycetaceae bacterium]
MPSIINIQSAFPHSIRQSFRLQHTIAQSAELHGFGFWTSEDVTLQFRPGRINSGIVFFRSDIDAHPSVPALVEYREEKPRQTSLVNGAARVDMVEHLLAAVKALQIDNLEIWTDQPEMPGFDGSSRCFFDILKEACVVKQPAFKPVRVVTESFRVGSGTQYITASPHPHGLNSYRYSLVPQENYPLEAQDYRFNLTPSNFTWELADSRTFVAKFEAERLIAAGLCKRVTAKDVLVLGEAGPIDNDYRYADECARHKILDMVGDFSLEDCDIVGSFESYRGGHSLNAECLREIVRHSMLLSDEYISQHNEIFCCDDKQHLKVA